MGREDRSGAGDRESAGTTAGSAPGIRELRAKSILHFHERAFATQWDANIYRGCGHNCLYCFAQYSHRYLGDGDFFEDIYVKANAPELLIRELGRAKWGGFPVNVCGVSDCYQPAEAECRVMPGVLRAFIAQRNPIAIATKSTLILRDIALIEELCSVADVSVAVSVSMMDEEKRRIFEPYAASTMERMRTLRKLGDIGCRTSVLLMPILPYISDGDANLDEVFGLTKELALGPVHAWPLHLRGNTKAVFYECLEEHFPELLPRYRELYRGSNPSAAYREDLRTRLAVLRRKYRLPVGRGRSEPRARGEAQLHLPFGEEDQEVFRRGAEAQREEG